MYHMAKPSSTQREIQQTRPFRSKRQEALISLLLTADRVRRQSEQILAGSGLSLQQYNVLRILRGAGAEGLCTLAIAQRMIERAPGITRLLDRLEQAAYVTRTRGEHDRREVRCQISRSGLALLKDLDGVVEASDDGCIGDLSAAELKQFLTLLERVRAGLPTDREEC